jgi:hypothetical protein
MDGRKDRKARKVMRAMMRSDGVFFLSLQIMGAVTRLEAERRINEVRISRYTVHDSVFWIPTPTTAVSISCDTASPEDLSFSSSLTSGI